MKLIKISAMWCPACIKLNKYWNKVEDRFKEIEFINYDLDFDSLEIEKYNVGNILPVLILQDDDKEKRLIGEKTYDEIVEFIEGSKK